MVVSQFHGEEIRKARGNNNDNNCTEFECKTCNRKFSSFQALGGHRASHKRPKLEGEDELKAQAKSLSLWNKPKTHHCSICGMEFSVGQALGGHMRKHRDNNNNNKVALNYYDPPHFASVLLPQVLSVSKTVRLDLNLTPLENDLKLLFGNYATPNVKVI
ncbi:zinc finger protein ZAT11-like [Senna tora]|uniref:Zinc finger protein ZAT11-like n=1 Tax=Senna tora TaxID=362788 RepID=A0A834WF11_9FABA|nr:zinc finger protein ZAT11-like [Senna tora]